MLAARLYRNAKATEEWSADGTDLVLSVPTKRPAYLVPPLSWLIRPPSHRKLHIDRTAADLWQWCDGKKNVEEIIDLFAEKHNLTFHESRVSVTSYLKELLKRGALAVAV